MLKDVKRTCGKSTCLGHFAGGVDGFPGTSPSSFLAHFLVVNALLVAEGLLVAIGLLVAKELLMAGGLLILKERLLIATGLLPEALWALGALVGVVAEAVVGVVGVEGIERAAGAGLWGGAGRCFFARVRVASAAFFSVSAASWQIFFVCKIRNCTAQSRRSTGLVKFARAHSVG